MFIGKIVKSDSHINYVCQVYGPHEVETQPDPEHYAFGRFVRIALRAGLSDASRSDGGQEITTYIVGVIYDTLLLNPAFGTLGPRLSTPVQVEVFSPDYLSEQMTLISILVLGTLELRPGEGESEEVISAVQGIPLLSADLGGEIEAMQDALVQAFHFFGDTVSDTPYLHMGYLSHVLTQRNSLLPMVTLRIIDQLEQLFPNQQTILSILKRNFSWRLKVESTG